VGDVLMPGTRKRVVIALVVVVSALFVVLAIVTAVGDLPDLEVRLSPGWLALSVLLLLVFQPLCAELWRRLLHEVGGELPRPRAHAIFNVSLLTRYVPTSVLLAVSRIELSHREGVPRSVTVASFAYEFALSVGTAGALAVSFVISLDSLQGHAWRFLVLLAPVALLLALHPRVIDALETRVARRFGVTSAHVTIPLRRHVGFVASYLIVWLVAGLGVWAMARGIQPVDGPDLTSLTSYAIGFAAAAVAFVLPAGLGARDIATATALSASMPFSVALTASIGVRLVQTAIELFYAGTTTLWARRAAVSAARP
jgi:hypothetical protein